MIELKHNLKSKQEAKICWDEATSSNNLREQIT